MSTSGCIAENKTLNIIHFNDVYNITECNNGNKCGGASRFMALISKLKSLSPPPLTFFSGDFLNPSLISTVTKGKHMIPVMNNFGITCGMIGNHDLDYGNKHCIECLSQLNYPTLNSNIFTLKDDANENKYDESNLEALGKCKQQLIIKNYYGFNIGIIGIAEDWCDTLPSKPKNGIIYKDFIQQCEDCINEMKSENNLNLVIVLTHSRKENDILLANNVAGIDLILGGHDHLYCVEMNKINKSLLVKSGCDFKGLTYIQLQCKGIDINNNDNNSNSNQSILSELNNICLSDLNTNLSGLNYNYATYHYNINNKIEADIKMLNLVNKLSNKFLSEISQPIGFINCNLDTRFEIIRKYESGACNLICDIVRNAYKCDIVLLCGGGIRSDKIHKKGIISYKDILDLVPFQDPIIVKKVIGKNIINAVKHSILNLPKLDGRFAHVSGLKYIYDSSKEAHQRLINIKVNKYNDIVYDEEKGNNCTKALRFIDIDQDKYYTIASRQYTMNGGDGFECLSDTNNKIIVDDDTGLPLSVLLRNFFWAISTINDAIKLTKNNKSLLKIEPTIEGRIVDIATNVQNGNVQHNANKNVHVVWSEMYEKLPSFINMTHKPQRRESIVAFCTDFEP